MDKNQNNTSQSNIFARSQLGPFLLMGLLLATVVVCFLILRPYIYPIVLAGVFAMIFFPVYQFILKKVRNRPNLASIITCALISLFVIVPIITFASMLVVEGTSTYTKIKTWVDKGNLQKELRAFGLADTPGETTSLTTDSSVQSAIATAITTDSSVQSAIATAITTDSSVQSAIAVEPNTDSNTRNDIATTTPVGWKKNVGEGILWFQKTVLQNKDKASLERDVIEKSQATLEFLGPKVLQQAKKGIGLVISFFLMMFVLFYFFRDGKKIMGYLLELSPLKKEHETLLIDRVKSVTRSAVIGTVLTAIAQGALGMIAFAISGIPWFFWGVIMGFASLIPVVGTALVWVPCCAYLLIVGDIWQACFLAIYSIAVVGSADNFLRPYFMKGDTGMSSIIAFFAILGGIEFFGLIGVVFGPLIFGVCAMLLYIYKLEVQSAAQPVETTRKRRPRRRRKPDNNTRDTNED